MVTLSIYKNKLILVCLQDRVKFKQLLSKKIQVTMLKRTLNSGNLKQL